MKKNHKIRTRRDIYVLLWDIFRTVFVITFTIMCIYPFYYVVIYSISDQVQATRGVYFWPRGFDLSTYKGLFEKGEIVNAYGITIARTVIGTALHIVGTSILAFLMTRQMLPGRKIIYRFFVVTMYMSSGILPYYLTMRAYHLNNTFWLYIIPGIVGTYNMILVKTYMEQLPESLEEAAAIEGAGLMDILFRIFMPLSKPILATIGTFTAVGQWNSWQDNFFLVQDSRLQTVQMILQYYLRSAENMANRMKQMAQAGIAGQASDVQQAITGQSVRMAVICVSVIPIMLVYPFAQKYFTKGIMMGAIKG